MTQEFTKTLPRSAWENVVIDECNEPLVLVTETQKLKIGIVGKNYKPHFYVRKTVANKLYIVANHLPEGICLVLIEGYRTTLEQQRTWSKAFNRLRKENPMLDIEKIKHMVNLVVAKPLPLANHHCGGAVDVTLMHSDGTLLDMGTPYPSDALGTEWHEKFPMLSEKIESWHAQNRLLLRNAMEEKGFVWYPGEWWHYCWGDRMWAVYSGRTRCHYGSVELP